MKMKYIVLIIFLIFVNINLISEGERITDNEYNPIEVPKINTSTLKNTIIIPYLNNNPDYTKNIVYCLTFQLAWNELVNKIIKEPISLDTQTEIVQILNQNVSNNYCLSVDSYIAKAGFVYDKIIDDINNELINKFGEGTELIINKYPEDSIIAYSFLKKNLEFETAFFGNFYIDFKDNNENKVQAFGLDNNTDEIGIKLCKQVNINYYDWEKSEFIITLIPTNGIDKIIIAKLKPKINLLDTIDYILSIIKTNSIDKLDTIDTLKIPKIVFNMIHNYEELKKKQISNIGYEEYFIAKAQQDIFFRLDEKGATLISKSELEGATATGRYLVCDGPFFVILREKECNSPYFVLYIYDDELLISN